MQLQHGWLKQENNLNINTLVFNEIKYKFYSFQKFNKSCFLCSYNFKKFDGVTISPCKKHLFHYHCLRNFVQENKMNKTNFFCPLCRNEEIKDFSEILQESGEYFDTNEGEEGNKGRGVEKKIWKKK